MDTRRLAAVADVQHLADGTQGDPGGLGLPDERQALEDGRAVGAVTGWVRAGGSSPRSSQNRIVVAGTPARPATSRILIPRPLGIPSSWNV